MLALSLFERYKEYKASERLLAEGKISDKELLSACRGAVNTFWKNTIITLASCIGFFVIIPVIIYSLSFVPALSASAEGFTVKGLIDAQKNMFNYHTYAYLT